MTLQCRPRRGESYPRHSSSPSRRRCGEQGPGDWSKDRCAPRSGRRYSHQISRIRLRLTRSRGTVMTSNSLLKARADPPEPSHNPAPRHARHPPRGGTPGTGPATARRATTPSDRSAAQASVDTRWCGSCSRTAYETVDHTRRIERTPAGVLAQSHASVMNCRDCRPCANARQVHTLRARYP